MVSNDVGVNFLCVLLERYRSTDAEAYQSFHCGRREIYRMRKVEKSSVLSILS